MILGSVLHSKDPVFIINKLSSDQMAQQMPGGNVAKIGDKRRAPEEEKKSVDPRDLMGRFRSKRDIYNYLLYHRKILLANPLICVGQYYMPPITKLNKDFLKEVFAGRKHLIPPGPDQTRRRPQVRRAQRQGPLQGRHDTARVGKILSGCPFRQASPRMGVFL
jgi:hypothetical protein